MYGAGFSEIRQVEFGIPSNQLLPIDLERHADSEWMKKAFVMIFEAEK